MMERTRGNASAGDSEISMDQIILTVPPDGIVEIFHGSFGEFARARGIPNAGPLLEARWIYCSVATERDRHFIEVHWKTVFSEQLSALENALLGLGVDRHTPCQVTVHGQRHPCTAATLMDLPGRLADVAERAARAPSRQALAADALRASVIDDDLARMTLSRVVWGEPGDVIRANAPGSVGLEGDTVVSGIYALHVGDVEFWHERLCNDYGRDGEAWEIEITPAPGDVLVDDPQYAIPEEDGSKADSAILLTDRKVLRAGVDFRAVRRLDLTAPRP